MLPAHKHKARQTTPTPDKYGKKCHAPCRVLYTCLRRGQPQSPRREPQCRRRTHKFPLNTLPVTDRRAGGNRASTPTNDEQLQTAPRRHHHTTPSRPSAPEVTIGMNSGPNDSNWALVVNRTATDDSSGASQKRTGAGHEKKTKDKRQTVNRGRRDSKASRRSKHPASFFHSINHTGLPEMTYIVRHRSGIRGRWLCQPLRCRTRPRRPGRPHST